MRVPRMPNCPALIASTLAMTVLWGCGGGSGGQDQAGPPEQSGVQVALKPSPTAAELEDYIKAGFRVFNSLSRDDSYAAVADGATEADSADSSASTSNTQVAGVDEGDSWKYNGQHIYHRTDGGNLVAVIQPGVTPQRLGEIDVGFTAGHLYADESQLVVTSATDYANLLWWRPFADAYDTAQVAVFDIAGQSNPATQAANRFDIELDGAMVSTRKIGDDLFLVTQYSPQLPGWVADPQNDAEVTANEQLLAAADLSDFMPTITINGQTEDLTESSSCYLVKDETDGYPVMTSMTRVNLQTGQFTNACVLGPVSGLYMSQGNAYLFNHASNYVDFIAADVAERYGQATEQTHVHKFALSQNLAYRGSNVVAGHASCNEARYCFGELNDGALAMVTTYGWWQDIEHHLTVLSANDMSVRSQLPNAESPTAIGKPGELLYAARILGDRAYLVTFLNTDPLYALDLSNSAAPIILGELEIPGFSDYLHPVNEDLLIGIGRDAVNEDDFARVQGVKVDLFDVSDMTQPSQIASYVLGGRGSSTPVSYDSHAFSALWVGQQFRFVIPVTIYASDSNSTATGATSFQYDGFQAFEIDTVAGNTPQMYALPATQLRLASDTDVSYWEFDARSTLIGERVYLYHNRKVYTFDWSDTESVELIE